jgi:hypothetical protein
MHNIHAQHYRLGHAVAPELDPREKDMHNIEGGKDMHNIHA